MIGWLIQQQHVGRHYQCARQRDPFFQSAGKVSDQSIFGKVKLVDDGLYLALDAPAILGLQLALQILQAIEQCFGISRTVTQSMRHLVVIEQHLTDRTQAVGHLLEHCIGCIQFRFLRHIGQLQRRRAPHLAIIQLDFTRQNAQQAGLTAAVAANQADAFARIKLQIYMIKQRMVTKGKTDFFESNERHGCGNGGSADWQGRDSAMLRGGLAKYLLITCVDWIRLGCEPWFRVHASRLIPSVSSSTAHLLVPGWLYPWWPSSPDPPGN